MWIVTDKWGNEIRLTDERWEHIIEGWSLFQVERVVVQVS